MNTDEERKPLAWMASVAPSLGFTKELDFSLRILPSHGRIPMISAHGPVALRDISANRRLPERTVRLIQS